MTFTKTQKREMYSICSVYKRFAKLHRCTRHSILESKLEEYVLEDLRRISKLAAYSKRLLDVASNNPNKLKIDKTSTETNRINGKLIEIKNAIRNLYEDKLKGILSEADFIDLSQHYNQQRDQLNQQLEYINKKLEKLQQMESSNNSLFDFVKTLTDLRILISPYL